MSDNERKFKSDKVLECPMCGKEMCVMDKMPELGSTDVLDEPYNVDYIIFEYNCSSKECGMLAYYPFLVSEVPDGESYFE